MSVLCFSLCLSPLVQLRNKNHHSSKMATTTTTTTSSSSSSLSPTILPKTGFAKVQSVLSGDTVVLLGKATQPNQPAPQVLFTLSSVSAPVSLFVP